MSSSAAAAAATSASTTRLKYKDLSLRIDADFWHELEHQKLHRWKLDEPTVAITAFASSLLGHTVTSAKGGAHGMVTLVPESVRQPSSFRLPNHGMVLGQLTNYNTIEQLQQLDKKKAIVDAGKAMFADVFDTKSSWNQPLPTPSSQSSSAPSGGDAAATTTWCYFPRYVSLHLFTFADLKKHEFHYCAAFPAIDLESPIQITKSTKLGRGGESDSTIIELEKIIDHAQQLSKDVTHATAGIPFVVITTAEGALQFLPFHSSTVALPNATIVFVDSAAPEDDHPGWALRGILSAVRLTHPDITALRCLALRGGSFATLFELACSPVSRAFIDEKIAGNTFKTTGWVDTSIHKIDMGGMMDPVRLAESSAKLNLSLMKWRMLPDLQLEGLSQCKALLLGSGTLGCCIARHLLMWGVTNITMVDRGNVSYSNPVRQTLFEMNDVIAEGELKCKSIAATNSLKRILPSVNAKGINLTIRMPGHRVDPGEEERAKADIKQLEDLIKEHDVIFLLTDSRESRWLPTVLAALHDKPVINTALGFDTYVVMRHGVTLPEGSKGHRLGCYFCNDVVAPQDSLTARSLDQQCTVTRPGVSAISSALSVELLAALYNHPDGFRAPPYAPDEEDDDSSSTSPASPYKGTPLGVLPHQLRGNVYTYQLSSLRGQQYNKCTACSDIILNLVRERGYDFLIECLNRPLLMEEVTGLKAEKDAVAAAYADWDDDTAFDD